MWLAEEMMRINGIREKSSVEFWVPDAAMFGVKKYCDMLERERVSRDVQAHFHQELVSIGSAKKIATFRSLVDGSESQQAYDVMHVVPPMSAPNFISLSTTLTDESGYVAVDKHTLQSVNHPNVFALGDCCNAPTSKTAAAVIAQAPVVVHNLVHAMKGQPCDGVYNGYSSCPVVVGKNRAILAEFGYDGVLMETFGRDTGKFPLTLVGQDGTPFQQRLHYLILAHLFPFIYFHLWTRGRWYGPSMVFKPDVTAAKRGLQ